MHISELQRNLTNKEDIIIFASKQDLTTYESIDPTIRNNCGMQLCYKKGTYKKAPKIKTDTVLIETTPTFKSEASDSITTPASDTAKNDEFLESFEYEDEAEELDTNLQLRDFLKKNQFIAKIINYQDQSDDTTAVLVVYLETRDSSFEFKISSNKTNAAGMKKFEAASGKIFMGDYTVATTGRNGSIYSITKWHQRTPAFGDAIWFSIWGSNPDAKVHSLK